ncbi:MAG: BatD family protein [Candidatus Omnitrophica bacterium]|nr:BatD family protein [Candidatus Omnitrophota bacterium]
MAKLKDITRGLRFLIAGLAFAFYVSGFTLPCFAKELNFEATVDRNKVSLGSSLQLALSFSNAQDIPAPQLPNIEGFQSRYIGPATMMSIVNGKVSGSITHNYLLLPTKTGTFKIGPFKFEHNGDKYTSNQLNVEVLQGQVQQAPNQPGNQPEPEIHDLSNRIFVTMQAGKNKAYLNETVPLTIKLYVNRLGVRDIQYPEFNHDGFSSGAFEKPRQYQETRNGVYFDVIEFNTLIFGLRPGEFNLGPANIKCNLIVRKQARRRSPFASGNSFDTDIFSDFFGGYETYPLDLKSGDIAFTVLPLPEESKPANFSGALGNFNLEVTAAPSEVKVGDPITLKMIISGEGNFTTVLPPKLKSENGFKVYEPQIKQEDNEKKFEQIIMPMSADIKEIPALSFDFFDIQSGQYKTITRGPFPITVLKPEKEEESKIVESRQVFSSVPAGEEKLGRDIIYIKDNLGPIKKKDGYLYKNKVFLILQLIPLFLYLITLMIYAKQKRLKTDVRYARGLLAPRKAAASIRQAKRYLDKPDAQKFYDTLFTTLQQYLGDKFHLSSKGITISVIDEHLRNTGVGEEVLAKLRDIFRECDMVRYASSQLTRENMRDSLVKLEEVIDYFQRRKT